MPIPSSPAPAAVQWILFCAIVGCAPIVSADGLVAADKSRRAGAPVDVALDFRSLAQQRPWSCADAPDATTTIGAPRAALCAWQNRLSLYEWDLPASSSSCVSAQAAWWAAGGRSGDKAVPTPRLLWRTYWDGAGLVQGDGLRVRILRRMPDARWRASEWRWDPSPRPATRRWQQGRWNLLVARARAFHQSAAPPGSTSETAMLWRALEANIGARVGELGERRVSWRADGLCLQVDAAAPGPQQLQLPYSADDSRLEQRAAMQLQLARRFSKATWLTPFTLAPTPPKVKSGAKFYAIWAEGRMLNGQLWIPTRGEGPLVRVRIATTVAPATGAVSEHEQVVGARAVIERELLNLAAHWAILNE